MLGEIRISKEGEQVSVTIRASSKRQHGIAPRVPLMQLLGTTNHVRVLLQSISATLAQGAHPAITLEACAEKAREMGVTCNTYPALDQAVSEAVTVPGSAGT